MRKINCRWFSHVIIDNHSRKNKIMVLLWLLMMLVFNYKRIIYI